MVYKSSSIKKLIGTILEQLCVRMGPARIPMCSSQALPQNTTSKLLFISCASERKSFSHDTAIKTNYILSIYGTNRLQEAGKEEKITTVTRPSLFDFQNLFLLSELFVSKEDIFVYHFLLLNCVLLQGASTKTFTEAKGLGKKYLRNHSKWLHLL